MFKLSHTDHATNTEVLEEATIETHLLKSKEEGKYKDIVDRSRTGIDGYGPGGVQWGCNERAAHRSLSIMGLYGEE